MLQETTSVGWETIGGGIAATAGIITTVWGLLKQNKKDHTDEQVSGVKSLAETILALQSENKRLRERLFESEQKIDNLEKRIEDLYSKLRGISSETAKG